MGTPVILQRSAATLGAMPAAVGRNFSPNGDRVTLAVMDESKVQSLLGLQRAPGVAYEGYAIGRPIGSMTFDPLDASRAEFLRYSLQQIYFPAITNILSEDETAGAPTWFGLDKRDLTSRWPSWLTILAMTEDANEGVFGAPPATGNFTRLGPAAGLGQLTYPIAPETQQGFDASDAEVRGIVERDGLGKHLLWTAGGNVYSAHPLSSCRIGDDPATSACDDRHELRGHPGYLRHRRIGGADLAVRESVTHDRRTRRARRRAAPPACRRIRRHGRTARAAARKDGESAPEALYPSGVGRSGSGAAPPPLLKSRPVPGSKCVEHRERRSADVGTDGRRQDRRAGRLGGRSGGERHSRRLGRGRREDRSAAGGRSVSCLLQRGCRHADADQSDVRARQSRQALDRRRPARPEGQEIALRAIAAADVFITNIRPGALERAALDPATLLARFPRLIYALATGYGVTGVERDRAAYDAGAFWGRAGVGATLAPPGGEPPFPRTAFGDHATALSLAGGIGAALFARERSGRGRLVTTSLLRTGLYIVGADTNQVLRLGIPPIPLERTSMPNPLCTFYRAQDGRWIFLLGLAGRPPLARSGASGRQTGVARRSALHEHQDAPRAFCGADRGPRRGLRHPSLLRMGGASRSQPGCGGRPCRP